MSDYDDETTGEQRSRVWLLIAGGVLVLIVAMGVFVSITTLTDDDNRDEPSADPSSSPTPTSGTTDRAESVCGLEGLATEERTLSQPPENVDWTLIGQIAIPESESAGPGVVEDSGVRYCYAHTPEGALLAAANFYAWGEASRSDPVGVIERGVASGPGYGAALAQAEEAAASPAPEQSTPIQIRGFRMLAYSGDTALVDIAFQGGGPSGGYAHHQLELVWQDGDWRIRVLPDGTLVEGAALPDLTGYVPWMGA